MNKSNSINTPLHVVNFVASHTSHTDFAFTMNLLFWGSISYICYRFTFAALHAAGDEHLRQDDTLVFKCIWVGWSKLMTEFCNWLQLLKETLWNVSTLPDFKVFYWENTELISWFWLYKSILLIRNYKPHSNILSKILTRTALKCTHTA